MSSARFMISSCRAVAVCRWEHFNSFYCLFIYKISKKHMSVKEQYWKYSLITIILGLGLILFIKMSPFMGGILGACTIYIMVRKQMFYLTQEKHFKKSITAILLLIEAIMCFLVPLSLAVWLLINKLQTVNVDTTGFIHTVTNLADWLHTKTGYDLLNAENISSIASILPAIGQFLMGSISSFAVNAFVLVFVLYFMLIGGIQMEKYIRNVRFQHNLLQFPEILIILSLLHFQILLLLCGSNSFRFLNHELLTLDLP